MHLPFNVGIGVIHGLVRKLSYPATDSWKILFGVHFGSRLYVSTNKIGEGALCRPVYSKEGASRTMNGKDTNG
jgi:hypothetical protein